MLKPQILSSLVLLAPFAITGAHAQQGDEPGARKETFVLEEIVVTANRREQSLQEVAMSVSAFTGDFFEDSGVRDLAGLDQYTPSLKITQGTDSRSTSIRIRGIGSVGTNVGIDPSVGMFIDGVYQGRAGMSVADLLDIERVEVLRGPQGTLYGKNTAAGAISIITRKPSSEFEAEGEVTYNSDERLELRGMVNIPLGDSGHATRLTAYDISGDHLYQNIDGRKLNNPNKWGFKSRSLFDGGDDFGEFLLTLDYSKEDTDCCAVGVIDYNGLSSLNVPGTSNPSEELYAQYGIPASAVMSLEKSSGISPPEADPFGNDYWIDAETFNKIEVGGVAVEWNKDIFEDNTITFINAWRHYEADSAYDGDFTAWDAVSGSQFTDLDQYSSELRITSPGGETVDYQGGLYYYYSKLDSFGTFTQSQELVENMGLVPLYALSGVTLTDGTLNIDDNIYETTSYAVFGQAVWNISEDLSATLGLRYTYEKKEREGEQISDPVSPLDIPPVAGPYQAYDEDRDADDISPTLNIRYFFTPDVMGYTSISRGFKSGGFNQRRELAGTSAEFDDEIATSYEIGWKTNSEDRRLTFNGTLYYVDYEDFQSQVFNGTVLTVTNAGSMESYGSELELVYVPQANLTLSSALGYNKAEYKEFEKAQCQIEEIVTNWLETPSAMRPPFPVIIPCNADLKGEAIDNAPEWTLSSFAQYDMEFGDNLIGVARLEHSYVDSYYLDQDLDKNLKNKSVNLINLRYTLSNAEQSWEAALWARNILDEEYYAFGIDIPVLGGYAGVAAPGAVYGITLRIRR